MTVKFGNKSSNWQGGPIKRLCRACGISFKVDKNVVRNGNGIFCSRSCTGRRDYGRKLSEKIDFQCVICTKKFLRYKSDIDREPNRGKCCSNKCRVILTIKKIKKTCLCCKKKFYVHPSNLKQSSRNFCNIKCYKKFKRIKTKCKICKKDIISYKNRSRKFCSKKCQHVGFSGTNNPWHNVDPEKHPAWKGGISFLPYPPGWSKKFKESVRARDQFKCKLCQIHQKLTYRKLDVHHIDYDKNNLSLKNLVSLCLKCHTKTNHKREQWTKKLMEMMK